MSQGPEVGPPQQQEASGILNGLRIGRLATICGGVELVAEVVSVLTGEPLYTEVVGPVIDAGLVGIALSRARNRLRSDTSTIDVITPEPTGSETLLPEIDHNAFSSEWLNPQPEPEPQEESIIQTESSETNPDVEFNRKSAEYLHTFFGIISEDLEIDIQRQDQITELARKSDPAVFPDNVYKEMRETIGRIAGLVKDREEHTITLFDSSRSNQPNGLSVAIALRKTGFATSTAREQYESNTELSEEGVVTTSADIPGKYHLQVSYAHNGVDTKVSLSLIDPANKPESVAPIYPDRPDIDRKRARFHGHEIWTDMGGVSRGRKRGQLPPG